jgi:hypothetical protein
VKPFRLSRARSTLIAPLAALVATIVVALAAAATSGLALCHREVALAMPMGSMPMGSMQMGDPSGIDLCPVVIGLGVLAISLGLWAVAAFALERHRRVARHRLIGMLAGLPPVRTSAGLIAVTAIPIALVILVDDGAPSSLERWLELAALLVGGSLLAVSAAIFAARVALAFGRRLAVRVARALRSGERNEPRVPVVTDRYRRIPTRIHCAACVLAAGLGRRAPPTPTR